MTRGDRMFLKIFLDLVMLFVIGLAMTHMAGTMLHTYSASVAVPVSSTPSAVSPVGSTSSLGSSWLTGLSSHPVGTVRALFTNLSMNLPHG